jgi:dTDP-glucose pyrophosphorylase
VKGILLAGGSMVYNPLSTLMLAGIRDILLISTPQDTPRFRDLPGDGSQWGLRLSYAVQPRLEGIAQALLIGREFIARGELEITDVNRAYLERGELEVVPMQRGMAWLDTGSFESLLGAASFIETIERRQGLKIACPEEVAYRTGFVDDRQLETLAHRLEKSGHGEYLLRVLSEPVF